jgi:hypothetical protein
LVVFFFFVVGLFFSGFVSVCIGYFQDRVS